MFFYIPPSEIWILVPEITLENGSKIDKNAFCDICVLFIRAADNRDAFERIHICKGAGCVVGSTGVVLV